MYKNKRLYFCSIIKSFRQLVLGYNLIITLYEKGFIINFSPIILIISLRCSKEIFEKRNEAIAFLNEKIYKQKVFIKYDNIKYDENDNLLCYLFLKNGMFINNYLVKKGLADIDEKYNFIYKTKFQNLKNKISIK